MQTKFGVWHKSLRAQRRMTQKEVAIGLGIDQPFISKLELGQVKPTVEMCSRIANFFAVPVEVALQMSEQLPDESTNITPLTPESRRLALRIDIISKHDRAALIENIDALITVCERREFQTYQTRM